MTEYDRIEIGDEGQMQRIQAPRVEPKASAETVWVVGTSKGWAVVKGDRVTKEFILPHGPIPQALKTAGFRMLGSLGIYKIRKP